jgi:hypothetical protein
MGSQEALDTVWGASIGVADTKGNKKSKNIQIRTCMSIIKQSLEKLLDDVRGASKGPNQRSMSRSRISKSADMRNWGLKKLLDAAWGASGRSTAKSGGGKRREVRTEKRSVES